MSVGRNAKQAIVFLKSFYRDLQSLMVTRAAALGNRDGSHQRAVRSGSSATRSENPTAGFWTACSGAASYALIDQARPLSLWSC